MTGIRILPAMGENTEISALIELMNKAGQRLEELTAGEIDSIAGTDGRMFVLQHAQEQLRSSETIKQAAILNALPAHIALLNAQGLIISVNEGWQQFATINMFIDSKHGVGTNYLQICDLSTGNNSYEAQLVAEGIRSVLVGSEDSFMIEYPCHSPTQQHWFLMTVTPLVNGNAGGVVVMHVNITQRKQAEERLRHLALAMDGTTDAIYLIDRATMKYVHVNDAACHMHNKQRNQLIALPPWEVNLTSRAELETIYDGLITTGLPAKPIEFTRQRVDGSQMWVELRQQAELSEERWKIITVERDITERREAGARLHRMAHYDVLTGLPNRKLFYDVLSKALIASSTSKRLIGVLFIDLDHFKIVNDTLGHAIGDELLIQFSNRLVECVRIRDTVGRLGGDEFAIILVMENDGNIPAIVANKIKEILRMPFDLKGHEMAVTASIGITIYPNDASDTETLIKYADTAMYNAKHAGRDTYRFFTAQMNVEMLAKLDVENALHKALVNGEFILYYQPKLDIKSGRISGLEALIRWQRPGHGLVSPAEFIPVLEETGLIVAVGSWVINAVCKQISLWMGSSIGAIQVSVNVSNRQFIEGDLHGEIVKALTDYDVPASLLELELTESTLMGNTNQTIETLQILKKEGVEISIDDFGTGYSSLAYLRRFPIDKLKIDIAFVRNITSNPDDAAMALAIIRIAHSLKLEVIAEGVETIEQLECLNESGCDQIQGYFFSRPLPLLELEKFLLDKKPFIKQMPET
ncbi:MAG: EAL domain-containing protein [Pseudomonadota bacterium]